MHNSVSADQVAAGQLGMHTRFSSIQLNGAERGEHLGTVPAVNGRIKTESRCGPE